MTVADIFLVMNILTHFAFERRIVTGKMSLLKMLSSFRVLKRQINVL